MNTSETASDVVITDSGLVHQSTGEKLDPEAILDLLEEAVAHHVDIMPMALAAGDDVTTQEDDAHWFQGYEACLIERAYGKNSLEEFAKGIRQPVDRIREYRTVCKFYRRQVWSEFRKEHPSLTMTHFRRAKRLKDPTQIRKFLEQAERDLWSTERTRIEAAKVVGAEVPPMRKAWEVEVLLSMTDGRLLLAVPGVSSESIMELVQEHGKEEEYSATLALTFAAPVEEPITQGETNALHEQQSHDPQPA